MQQLRTISAQSTVLLVTHQIKFAQSAHQILFMYKDGDQTFLVTGTHNELRLRMDTCGEKYRELDDLQSSQSYANFWVNRNSSTARSGQSSNAATLSRGGDVRDTALSFERK
jgi:ABC-type multidrug transport system ATPase subunit